MVGRSPLVIAGTAVALAVSLAGLARIIVIGTNTLAQTVVALTAVGLSGAVQVGLLPEEAGYLIIFVALIGIGMDLPPRLALTAGLVVFAAANFSFLVVARMTLGTSSATTWARRSCSPSGCSSGPRGSRRPGRAPPRRAPRGCSPSCGPRRPRRRRPPR